MVKVIKIIEDNSITGVKYGTVEIPETGTDIKHTNAQKQFAKLRTQKTQKIRNEHTKNK